MKKSRLTFQPSVDEYGNLMHVATMYGRLDHHYVLTDLGNKTNPMDELIFILLSARTPEPRYEQAYARLVSTVGDWDKLTRIEEKEIVGAIGNAGLSTVKAKQLKRIAAQIEESEGHVSLECLRNMTSQGAEEYLCRLPGVGVKTAKCVLMYSLDRNVLPLDTHCLRIAARFGWFKVGRPSSDAHMLAIEGAVPPYLRKGLHIRLVQHGRAICQPKNPRCEMCCLEDICLHAQTGMADPSRLAA